jgi:threonine dehydratase
MRRWSSLSESDEYRAAHSDFSLPLWGRVWELRLQFHLHRRYGPAMTIDTTSRLQFSDIEAAARRLHGVAVRTPLINFPVLDEAVGAHVFLKAETLQRMGAFKFRGAYNRCAAIPQERRAPGVVAYSSGNHAQAVAAAAKLLGMPAAIVMPADAPRPKRDRTAALGAEVVLYDRDTEDRAAIATAICETRGATLVPPFDDPFVIAGQGTAGLEIIEDLTRLGLKPDLAVVQVSGGGLAAGIALAMKTLVPETEFQAVEPEGFDDTLRSFRSGQRETNPRMSGTICDGLMTERPGALTFPITSTLIGQGVTVTDAEVGRAVAFAWRELKLVVEPSGAIGIAAMLTGKIDVKGKVVVAVLSGGNIDPQLFCTLIAE